MSALVLHILFVYFLYIDTLSVKYNIRAFSLISKQDRVKRMVRMNDLREEIGMRFSLTGRIVRSQMGWVWMEVGRLPKEAEVMKQPGCRKRVQTTIKMQ